MHSKIITPLFPLFIVFIDRVYAYFIYIYVSCCVFIILFFVRLLSFELDQSRLADYLLTVFNERKPTKKSNHNIKSETRK